MYNNDYSLQEFRQKYQDLVRTTRTDNEILIHSHDLKILYVLIIYPPLRDE